MLLFMAFTLAFAATGRRADAMFLSPPEKEDKQAKTDQEAPSPEGGLEQPAENIHQETPPQPGSLGVTSDAVRPEDAKLREQLDEITAFPVPKRKVNSRTFLRMSGETDKLKPVTLPPLPAGAGGPSHSAIRDRVDPQEKAFTIGSWAFVLVCLAGAAFALRRIRKLSSSS